MAETALEKAQEDVRTAMKAGDRDRVGALRMIVDPNDALLRPPPRDERDLVIAGAGPAAFTAREGALKLREGARVPAVGHDIEFLLHGSAVPLDRRDALAELSASEAFRGRPIRSSPPSRSGGPALSPRAQLSAASRRARRARPA